MNIKKEEWAAFAEFIAVQSTWNISQYIEDGNYICCPFSTIERAYVAFSIWKTCHSQSEVRKFYDVDYVKACPDYNPMEEEYYREQEGEQELTALLIKQQEIEYCYEQQYPDCTWQDEWDNYIPNRRKQIIRIAHELADRHENLHVFGNKSWVSLVYPFYEKYELNSEERCLFTQEYYSQHFFRYGYV